MNQNPTEGNRNPLIHFSPATGLGQPFNTEEQAELNRLAHSDNVADKRRCVDILDAATPQNRELVFALANILIPSRSAHVRWGTLINLGKFSQTHTEELWPLVLRWGTVPSEDIRGGVACCILEHILETHFDEYVEKAKVAILIAPRFRFTLRMCWRFGEAAEPKNDDTWDALVSLRKPNVELT